MAKELPYFRFTAAEWLNGDISLEATYLKGVFIDICSYYWFKDCSITKAMLKKKYSHDVDAINDLIELGILKHDEETDYLCINFLNEQYDVLSEQRKRRQKAGAKGGKQKSSNAKAELKQSSSYKDKDKDKDKDNNKNRDYISSELLVMFNNWLNYKKERKQTYKSETSIKAAYNNLIALSENKADVAEKIINQSIANNWAGLFELKQKANNNTNFIKVKNDSDY